MRRAPVGLYCIEVIPDPPKIGLGTHTRDIPDLLLSELIAAYREAAKAPIDLRQR